MNGKQLLVLGLVGVAVAAALTAGGFLVSEYWTESANAQQWLPALTAAEQANGIPSGLLSRIAYQESSFDTNVINGTTPSSAGALGMMQLEPAFFSSVQVPVPFTNADITNQINQAAEQLASLYAQFGNWTDAVAAYNAGEGTIQNVLAGTEQLPTETANYIAAIGADLPNVVSQTLQGAGSGSTMTASTNASPAGNTGYTGGTTPAGGTGSTVG
jgi:peptidoglycan DL-endopeptidase CwlO